MGALLFFLLSLAGLAQTAVASAAASSLEAAAPLKASASLKIVVDLPSRTLSLYSGGFLLRRYPVAIGHPQSPSPLGTYRVAVKVVNPTWYPKKRPPVPPGPQNPVGTRWLGLDLPEYGIHGTNNPPSIGQAVSGGCIRMHNADVEELFQLVPVGTPVEFTYEAVEVSLLPPGEPEYPPQAGEESLLYTYGLTIHPDVYRRGLTLQHVQERIRQAGIGAELDTARLQRQIKEANGSLEPLPVVPRIVVAGRPARRTRLADGRFWLPLSEAAELAGCPLYRWEAPITEYEGEPWVSAADFAWQMGYRVKAVPSAAALYLWSPLVFFRGVPVGRAFSRNGEELLVPVGALAQAVGQRVDVDPCLSLAVGEGGRTAPVALRAEEAWLDPVRAAGLLAEEVSVTDEGVWFGGPLEQLGEELRGDLDLQGLLEGGPVPADDGADHIGGEAQALGEDLSGPIL